LAPARGPIAAVTVSGRRTNRRTTPDRDLIIALVSPRCRSGAAPRTLIPGKKYLDAKDDTFAKAGKVGLWTKADAQTSFDNFRAKELE
jgi:hypothetical protein